jgi:hypothetical protein
MGLKNKVVCSQKMSDQVKKEKVMTQERKDSIF